MKVLVIGKEGRLERQSVQGRLDNKEIVYVPMDAEDESILLAGTDADYVLIDAMGTLSEKVIFGMKQLKMIHSEGVGYQGIDLNAATKQGIYVCNCKGMNARAV